MGAVFPKVAVYVFLSVICLLINISACVVAMADTSDYGSFLGSDDVTIEGVVPEDKVNVTLANVGFSAGASFVPFFSIVSLLFLGLDAVSFAIISIVIAIIGALQIILLSLIVLNFLPKVLGSGFDV